MHNITIVSLGPGAADHLTLGGLNALKGARQLLLRTRRHAAVPYLEEQGLTFDSLDGLYEHSEDFEAFAAAAVQDLLARAEKGPLCYAVADPTQDETVRRLRPLCGEQLTVLPGVMLEAPLLARQDPERPLVITDAMHLAVYDAQRPLCLTELNSRALAGDCKLKLLEHYDADSVLYFFPPGEGRKRRCVKTTLEELDRQPRYDHTAGAMVLPKAPYEKDRYDVQDLVSIMRRLRAPDGCPWDREQTHRSLSRYLVEEANEAAQAIALEDWAALTDELGDVLLQVVFHATVGEETGTMTLNDISSAICRKLIRRHRHIFGDDVAPTAQAVSDNWDKIKEEERGKMTAGQKMRALPASLPSLLRAVKVQEAARKVGFDWDDPLEALAKVPEEAQELLAEAQAGRDPAEEMGDLLFACVNVARLLGCDPDEVVNKSTEKFIKRFEWMENALKKDQKASKCLTLEEWGIYWDRSKQSERGSL